MTEAFETGRSAEVDATTVHSREDAIGVVLAMLNDLRKNADAWQNAALDTYLEALAAAMEDLDQVYEDRGELLPDQPSWQLIAELHKFPPDTEVNIYVGKACDVQPIHRVCFQPSDSECEGSSFVVLVDETVAEVKHEETSADST